MAALTDRNGPLLYETNIGERKGVLREVRIAVVSDMGIS